MKKLAIALLLILGCSVSYAQSNLSIEKLWSLGRVAYQGISNDGATLYYSVSVPNIAENKSKTTDYAIPLIGGKAIEIAAERISDNRDRWTSLDGIQDNARISDPIGERIVGKLPLPESPKPRTS